MEKIRALLSGINKFDYAVKILKAAIVGFEAFNDELERSLPEKTLKGNGKERI